MTKRTQIIAVLLGCAAAAGLISCVSACKDAKKGASGKTEGTAIVDKDDYKIFYAPSLSYGGEGGASGTVKIIASVLDKFHVNASGYPHKLSIEPTNDFTPENAEVKVVYTDERTVLSVSFETAVKGKKGAETNAVLNFSYCDASQCYIRKESFRIKL